MAGAAWALLAKFVGVGGVLVVNALLARMLSPEEMGAYFVTVSIVMFLAILASFGLRQTVVRLVAESIAQELPGKARKTMITAFCIAGAGSIVVSGSYFIFLGDWLASDIFKIPVIMTATGIITFWIVILTFQTPVSEVFRGLNDIRSAVFLDGTLASGLLALLLVVLYIQNIDLNYSSAVMISMLAAGVSLTLGIVLFWHRRSIFNGRGDISSKEVVIISAPLFVTNVSNYIINQFSLWIVAAYLPASDVALYGAAWRLVNLIALPLLLMNMTVNPVIAGMNASNQKTSLQNALRGTATLAAIPALIALLGYMIFGAEILTIVFGKTYADASQVLLILSIGMLANVWTGSCGQVLAMTGHQRELMLVSVVTGLFSVALTIFSVTKLGLIGVALSVATGRIVLNIVSWLMVWRLTGLWTHGTLRPSFLKLAFDKVRNKTSTVK